jgi:hypothetical protein
MVESLLVGIWLTLCFINGTLARIADALESPEHGADAGTPVSGPSRCSPASPRAGDKGAGLEGKPPVPRRVGEPGNAQGHVLTRSEAEGQ